MKKCEGRGARIAVALVVLGALVAVAWGPVAAHLAAARLLAGVSDAEPLPSIRRRDETIARLRARTYDAAGGEGAPLLLVHGVHPRGIDEPRLVRFAQLLAREGFRVTTPELESLTRFHVEADTAAQIASCARALAHRAGTARVGVVGISFGGGLALLAAADEPRIGAVLAIGAHHDARRLARWWTGEAIRGPDGATRSTSSEPYGREVLAHLYAEAYFGEASAETARAAIEARLRGDREALRQHRDALPTEARRALDAIRDGASPALRVIVEDHDADLAAASPAGQLDDVTAEVFLLHGADDPLVAPSESAWIDSELAPVRRGGLVVTPLLRHAEREDVGVLEELRVVHLVAGALRALREP